MPASALAPHQLRLTIDPATLGFASTAELQDLPLPWIGQERAQAAAQFGLGLHPHRAPVTPCHPLSPVLSHEGRGSENPR